MNLDRYFDGEQETADMVLSILAFDLHQSNRRCKSIMFRDVQAKQWQISEAMSDFTQFKNKT